MDDPQGNLPTEWYGLNYLGRPASVAVTGESPTTSASGAPSGGASSPSPTSGIGTTSPQMTPQGTTASSGAANSRRRSSVNAPLAGVSIAQNVAALANNPLVTGDKSISPNLTGAEGDFSGAIERGTTLSGAPIENPEAGPPPTDLAAGDLASGALNIANIGAVIASLTGNPPPPAVSFGLANAALLASAAVGNPWGLLAVPAAVTSGQALFSGPPSMNFPAQTWTDLSTAVSKNLPPKLPIPDQATPEQRTSIEQANAMIDTISRSFPSDTPSYLGGPQSEETWTVVMDNLHTSATDLFHQLQTVYTPALQTVQGLGGLTPELMSQLQTSPQERAKQDFSSRVSDLGSRWGQQWSKLSDPTTPEYAAFVEQTGVDPLTMNPQQILDAQDRFGISDEPSIAALAHLSGVTGGWGYGPWAS